jgi:hypothetical protein
MSSENGCERDQDRHADEGAGYAPEHTPEEYRKQHHERRDGNRRPRDAGFDIAADDELKKVEADEYYESSVERFELGGRE